MYHIIFESRREMEGGSSDHLEMSSIHRIFPIIPRFCRFCSCLEDGIFSRMSSQTGVSWKTVLSRSPLLVTKPGHLEKQYSQDAPVSEPSKPGYNVKNPPFSSGSLGKMQSSGLQNCPRTSTAAQSTVLGQFWRSLDCIFPRIPRKKVESWPNL